MCYTSHSLIHSPVNEKAGTGLDAGNTKMSTTWFLYSGSFYEGGTSFCNFAF